MPRPPVFVSTNLTGYRTNEFRYWLDLNRNGLFEPTGYVQDQGAFVYGTNFYVGDPQWIGVLEHPDRPHSETNRFVGRYAFVVQPVGKDLDLNYIHNSAKHIRADMSANDYSRDQGVGSWEINLAAFLAALNTNSWPTTPSGLSYNYITNVRHAEFRHGF